jgi:hypothetical protein
MVEVGNRQRNQPAPPRVIFEALTRPHRDPNRPWLVLLDDEAEPSIVTADEPHLVIWSTLWPHRPGIIIRFELEPDSGGYGTDLRWVLESDEPLADDSAIGHMRKRMNELINANLRYTFGQ